jgi:hypothetical protein
MPSRIPAVACAVLLIVAADPPRAIPSPEHGPLFAPPARAARFRFARTPDSIDAVARYYRERFPSSEPRSWTIERIAAADAFDGAALFDRSRLARLYRGRPPRVARGAVTRDGRVVEVVLLISPFPEPDLKRLNPGTLVMTVEVW